MERERAGSRQPGDSAVGAAGREEQGRVLHSLHASMCSSAVWFHVHLNQAAADACADLSFRDLFSNWYLTLTALPKFTSKYQNSFSVFPKEPFSGITF